MLAESVLSVVFGIVIVTRMNTIKGVLEREMSHALGFGPLFAFTHCHRHPNGCAGRTGPSPFLVLEFTLAAPGTLDMPSILAAKIAMQTSSTVRGRTVAMSVPYIP